MPATLLKETLTPVFSKNTYFEEYLRTAASVPSLKLCNKNLTFCSIVFLGFSFLEISQSQETDYKKDPFLVTMKISNMFDIFKKLNSRKHTLTINQQRMRFLRFKRLIRASFTSRAIGSFISIVYFVKLSRPNFFSFSFLFCIVIAFLHLCQSNRVFKRLKWKGLLVKTSDMPIY